MARLFISYKREEQAHAFALRQWLVDKQDWPSDEVFVDREKLHAGDSWANKIFREAEACEAMLFIASEASLRPDSFCYKELQRARGVTIAVTIGGLRPEDERLRSALPHGADARQITALDGQPTDAFSFVSPVDGTHGAIALNRAQVESIGQTLRDLGIAPNSFTWKVTDEGPYRGLGALQEGDEALFFGREREVRDCIRMLEQIRRSVSDRALLIQAPSGAGKSSLLRAGLWRRLRRHAAFSPLAIVRARQGVLSHEEWGLAAGLAKAEANRLKLPLGVLEDRIRDNLPRLLADFAKEDASPTGGGRTLLLGVDQAEEMTALSAPNEIDELRCLFAALAEAGRTLDLRLVLTARDDSVEATLERLAAFEIGQEAVRNYSLHRMPPPRFKDVIEKPAKVADQSGFPLKLDDTLTTALADAAAQNQGEFSDALPILALALQRLVKKLRAPDGTIMANPENAVRLVGEAVANAANEALESVGANEAMLRRLIIPRLATWDPRAGEGGAAKRRMASEAELFAGDRATLRPLAGALVDQRLLTRAGENYEVSHEALLRVAPLGALILELRGKFVRADMLTMEARDWAENGRRIEWVGRTGERLRDAQALLEDEDFGTMLSGPSLDIREYLKACADKDRQELELRERLEKYQLAQSIGAATQLQPQLREVEADGSPGLTSPGDGVSVYISYSRTDLMAVDRISEALRSAGFNIVRDFEQIAPGEDWNNRIEKLIEEADKFLFLLSPDSANSSSLAGELQRALSLGKAIVPVLIRKVDPSQIPKEIAVFNFIYMRDESDQQGMRNLIAALSTDIDWVREQTRYLQRATEWEAGGRPTNRLLSGSDVPLAKAWAARRPKHAPKLIDLILDFIRASEVEEVRQQGAEAQRLREVMAAQEERARALTEREEAQTREAEQGRRVVRRTLVGLGAAVVLAVMATGFATFAYRERIRAEFQGAAALSALESANEQRALAEENAARADNQTKIAEMNAAEARAQSKKAVVAAERIKVLEDALHKLDPGNPALKEP